MRPHDADSRRDRHPRPPRHRPSERPEWPGGRNQAAFVATPRPIPPTVVVGQRYVVAVTMRNTGTTTWRSDDPAPYRLGSQGPRDTTSWGLARVDVPMDVPPGAEVTFSFTVVAPAGPGPHPFQWRMVQEGVQWFGDLTPNTIVTVG